MPAARADRRVQVVVVLVVSQLLASVATAVVLSAGSGAAVGTAVAVVEPSWVGTAARPAPTPAQAPAQAPSQAFARERLAAVNALLQRRAGAVLTRDREGFLATVDPQAVAFRERQAALFDALAEVPLTAWAYAVRDDDVQPPDPALDARYGTWWAPRVVLGHALEGIDADPAEATQHLTFALRPQGWVVAADDDFEARGERTARALWDAGAVTAVRGQRSLVLGHPRSLPVMRRTADEVDAAIGRVSALVGTAWPQRVAVLVPEDQQELGRLVDTGGSLSSIAALAVNGPVRGERARGGDRVLVNPPNLARLGPTGRRVVLDHEVTHVAIRPAGGPLVPLWLAEGLADHVGYQGAGVPVRRAAAALRTDVLAGRLPERLPADADFDGDNPALAQVYEQAWLAVEVLVEQHGTAGVLALHAAIGAREVGPADVVLDEALAGVLGTTTAELTQGWTTSLPGRLR